MEKRILEVLARFDSLEREVLRDEVLRGRYSAAAENEFNQTLRFAIAARSAPGPTLGRSG